MSDRISTVMNFFVSLSDRQRDELNAKMDAFDRTNSKRRQSLQREAAKLNALENVKIRHPHARHNSFTVERILSQRRIIGYRGKCTEVNGDTMYGEPFYI